MLHLQRIAAPALALLLGTAASAQQPAAAAPAAATAPDYRSAFETYEPYKEQPTGSWVAVNDNVGRIGGWRAYAREAQGGAPAPAAAPPSAGPRPAVPPAGSPPRDPHSGHHR